MTGLYVRRNLLPASAAALTNWARVNGFTNIVPIEEMHSTLVYSTEWVDLTPKMDYIGFGQPGKKVRHLGSNGAVVLTINAPVFKERWNQAEQLGSKSPWSESLPHITITYDAQDVDVTAIEPYVGGLMFGPELHADLNESWAIDMGFRK